MAAGRFTLADRTDDRDRTRDSIDSCRLRLADLKAHGRGLTSRIEVLENLERSREGYGAGIREVLELIAAGEWGGVIGLVGDLLTAPREVAHLLDIALGPAAQCILVHDVANVASAVANRPRPFSGRVSFLPLRSEVVSDSADEPLARRADRLVSGDHPDLAGLPAQLLGATWIVPDLATARELAVGRPGHRFVTLAGDLLEADGSLTVGAHQPETGILSRKSELRDLRAEAAGIAEQIEQAERELADLIERAEELEGQLRTITQEIGVLAEQAADLRERIGRHRQRRAGLHEEVTLSRTELSGLDEEIERLERTWKQATIGRTWPSTRHRACRLAWSRPNARSVPASRSACSWISPAPPRKCRWLRLSNG